MRGMRFNDSSDAPGLIAGTAPVRQPGRGEMLIRVHTAGVTPTECIRLPTHPRRRKENRSVGHDQMGREARSARAQQTERRDLAVCRTRLPSVPSIFTATRKATSSRKPPGRFKPMVPEDSALLGCSNSSATTCYGSITQTESDGQIATYADVKFVPRQLSEPREEYHELRIASRPRLIPFDLSSWAVINPLT